MNLNKIVTILVAYGCVVYCVIIHHHLSSKRGIHAPLHVIHKTRCWVQMHVISSSAAIISHSVPSPATTTRDRDFLWSSLAILHPHQFFLWLVEFSYMCLVGELRWLERHHEKKCPDNGHRDELTCSSSIYILSDRYATQQWLSLKRSNVLSQVSSSKLSSWSWVSFLTNSVPCVVDLGGTLN